MFVQERALAPEVSLRVLDHERASAAIRDAEHRAVGVCYCRHKMEHVGRACSASREICLTLGNTARSLARHGFARAIDTEEGLDLLKKAQDEGLAQFGENVREQPAFICNCCGCCCEAMIAARRFGFLHPVHTTNYLGAIDDEACDGCGRCARACPVEAIEMIPDARPDSATGKRARRDADLCLGCGVCVPTCTREALVMEERPERVFTPVNSVHRAVLMAIERGTLQDLVFDNQAHRSHRAMAAVLGAILKLGPVKRALASEQLRSRYLDALSQRY
jgi:Pyruvate/2-oxoacid:ferredoxin oxidoreductase delta subunit